MPENSQIEAVITVIHGFIHGTGGAYDWDDFVSVPIKDSYLELIRIECAAIDSQYPAGPGEVFCSEDGVKRLMDILAGLRRRAGQRGDAPDPASSAK